MNKYFTLLITLILFIGCSNDEDESNTFSDFEGSWNMTFVGDYANADCSGSIDSTAWALSSAFGLSQVLEIDGGSFTQTTLMAGQVMESLSGSFSEVDSNPCLDEDCILINWITEGSEWSMDIESDAYCEDPEMENTSDTSQESCESNGDGYNWFSAVCTKVVYTK
tara:strand:+ start:1339 stop:1836 length:498 start_codon:yes stop_codon:yes gene_type:complete